MKVTAEIAQVVDIEHEVTALVVVALVGVADGADSAGLYAHASGVGV